MKKSEVTKLEDKNLQLRYFLGGLQTMNNNEYCHYWLCDINCSCNIVPEDERLEAVKDFIKNHNITNERFIKLSYNFINGAIMKYQGNYSQLFLELKEVLKPYQFTQTKIRQIPDNNFREEELEKLVNSSNDGDSIIGNFVKKYNLTVEDFIAMAKTILNYNIYGLQLFNSEDTFITEIKDIINRYNLSVPKEYIQEYIKSNQNNSESTDLIIETKSAQARYLELMKELLIKEPSLATGLISEELVELGFTNKKDINGLVLKKQKIGIKQK